VRWRCGHFLAGSVRAPIEQAWPKLRSRKICNGTGNGFQKIGVAQVLSHPSCCLVVFGAAAPRREVVLYHGSGICRRTRQQRAERGHQQRDTALVRNFVVLTLVQRRCVVTELSSPSSFWERLLCHAQPSHAQPSPPVLLWSIIVVTSHPLRHGTVVTVVVLGTAVVSRAAVAVGVIVVDHWCGVIRIIEIMTPWSWRHARAWPLGAKGLWAYCPSYTARSTQQK